MTIIFKKRVAQGTNKPRCPSTDEWVNQIRSINTREYYLALKRSEALIYATVCMDAEKMLREALAG